MKTELGMKEKGKKCQTKSYCRRNRTPRILFGFFVLASAFCLRTSGQSYSIDWYKIAGGGGTSTNGQYAVTGTIGQPDAGGAMAGGNYSLTGGFWASSPWCKRPVCRTWSSRIRATA